MHSAILSTLDTVPGREVDKVLGLVRGNAVRSLHFGRHLWAWVRSFSGGEMEDFTKLLAEVREQSLDRMVAEAQARGADAVIGLRFQTCEISSGVAELLAYGTAVRLRPLEPADAGQRPVQARDQAR